MNNRPITRFIGIFAFLSNFYECNVEFEDIVYPSSEHAYQAAKTMDRQQRRYIAVMASPGMAKRAGRQVEIRQDWDVIRRAVMTEILEAKFSQNDELLERLLATGNRILVEGNTWGDRYWGACRGFQERFPEWPDTGDGSRFFYGHNHLGVLLMKIRKELA